MEVLGEVEHRLNGDLGVGGGAPLADLLGGHRAGCLLEPGHAPGSHECGLGEVDVQHHLTLAATHRPTVRLGQVEGALVAGQVPDRLGATYVAGSRWSREALLVGVRGDRGLQVQGVGEVDVAVDPDPAGDADVGQGDVEVPRLGGGEAVGLGGLGVEPGLGFLDQPALGGADLVRDRRDRGVDERRRFG